ncbi:hypothetical protein [Maricaulis salignorans]|uniref:Uncharacterized protein n=1 Tax=Maricaulis salignorans TaxID=144026 RepID=A0A1G9QJ91_9PROT|nr:hypothetical protein [Maricaulis salignorans]SDM11053.1 hypothetical protein SAMN04488568_10543 [Maricaulis salignorans]
MPRKIDEKKTRKALRRLERAKRAAEQAGTPDASLSEWEGEFLGSLEERLETYGSAFNDPGKGDTEEALSARQALKLREIEKKAAGKARKPMSQGKGFKRKTPAPGPRSRDIHEDFDPSPPPASRPVAGRATGPVAVPAPEDAVPAPKPAASRPGGFTPRVIEGGKTRL